jgi:hypothetical protein
VRLSPHGRPAEIRALRDIVGEPGVFTTPETRFGGWDDRTRLQHEPRLAARIHLRGRFLPTMPEPIEPLAPLSPLLRSLHPCSRLRELPPSDVPFEPFRTGDEEEGVARLTLAPNRERRCLKSARGAFHQQGPFVGSGGHDSPGPASRPTARAMGRPLDDALTSPWALRRSSPYCSGESDSRFAVSPDAPSDALTRQKPPRARPLFTRP